MKKIVGLMFFLTCIVLAGISSNEKAFAEIPSDYEYDVIGGSEVTITGYTGESTDISIPSEIDGYVVTRIGNNAFEGNNLTSVIIPNTVTSIGNAAFSDNNLISVDIPNTVTTIGSFAFSYNDLTSVVIPNTVTSIRSGAFRDNSLINITLPDSIQTISDRAFTGNQLEEVIFSNNLQSIGDYAFSSNQLTNITLPNSVTSLGVGAFVFNEIETLTLSNSLTSINASVFMSNKLKSIVIPSNILRINENAFEDNELTSVSIPDNVTAIGEGAFRLNQLTQITIPNSITTIKGSAFSNNLLTSITIPDSVETIESYAFSNNQLTTVTLPNSVTSIGMHAFNNNRLTSVTLSNNITEIPYGAFSYNNLRTVTIPSNVTSIEDRAFASNQLSTIIFEGSIASLGQDVLSNQYQIGYTLENWYSDETRETVWDFNNPIVANTTLYAGYDINKYTVSFDSMGGSVIADLTDVNYDTLITAPTAPTKSGYTFAGWYIEDSLATKWDFAVDKVTENTTLFAKWTSTSGGGGGYYTPDPEPTPEVLEPAPQPAPAPELIAVPDFTDIEGHWAEDTIKKAVELGITSGYEDNTFRPNDEMTREEFAVMLAKALKLDGEASLLDFSDSDSIRDWATAAISSAVNKGILNGYPDGNFRPQANVTRAELAVMLANALGEAGTDENLGYADEAQIPAWAKSSIALLKQYNIMQGRTGNIFDAQGVTTRAEALTAIMKLLELNK